MKNLYYSTYDLARRLDLSDYVCVQCGMYPSPDDFGVEVKQNVGLRVQSEKICQSVLDCDSNEGKNNLIANYFHTVRGVDKIKYDLFKQYENCDDFLFLFNSWDTSINGFIDVFNLISLDSVKCYWRVYTSYIEKFGALLEPPYKPVLITRARVNVSFKQPAIWLQEYAPSWELLNDWKNGRITWEEYEVRYVEEQGLLNKERVILLKNKLRYLSDRYEQPLALLCFEAKGKNCHRHILGKYIGAEEL